MKRFIYILTTFILVISFSVLLTACGNNDDNNSSNSGEVRTLNVYNYGEYISDGSLGSLNVNEAFEKYCAEKLGMTVNVVYSTYATNEDMHAKITAGAGSVYDIVVPSDYMIQKMISENLLHKYDLTELENYKYIDEEFKNLYYDPTNSYSVPYTYGKVGIIYNSTMVDEEDVKDKSWDLLFNEKYAGKILQFNNYRDGLATAMYRLGLDVNSTNKADWDLAKEMLIAQKPLVQAYVSDEIYNKMISNSASISTYYAGDYITMKASNPDLAFYYPKEGTNVFVDAMCILESSKNKDLAKEYINFMLSEEIAVANAIYIGYASPHILVKDNEEYQDAMDSEDIQILYGEDEGETLYPFDPFYHDFDPEGDMQEYVQGLWEDLKTESSTEPWVHVTSALIVISLAALIGYNTYIKKKRSRDYRYRDREKQKAKNNS